MAAGSNMGVNLFLHCRNYDVNKYSSLLLKSNENGYWTLVFLLKKGGYLRKSDSSRYYPLETSLHKKQKLSRQIVSIIWQVTVCLCKSLWTKLRKQVFGAFKRALIPPRDRQWNLTLSSCWCFWLLKHFLPSNFTVTDSWNSSTCHIIYLFCLQEWEKYTSKQKRSRHAR